MTTGYTDVAAETGRTFDNEMGCGTSDASCAIALVAGANGATITATGESGSRQVSIGASDGGDPIPTRTITLPDDVTLDAVTGCCSDACCGSLAP